jgi:hypothetical protein
MCCKLDDMSDALHRPTTGVKQGQSIRIFTCRVGHLAECVWLDMYQFSMDLVHKLQLLFL